MNRKALLVLLLYAKAWQVQIQPQWEAGKRRK